MKIWSWRQAILKSQLESTTKLVLLALSTYMNDHGCGCYPSQEQVAADTSLSTRSVITHIDKAVAAGFLIKEKRGLSGQSWDANEYRAAVPETDSPLDVGVKDVHPTPENTPQRGEPVSGEGCSTFTQGVKDVHTNSPMNSSINSPIKLAREEMEEGEGTQPIDQPQAVDETARQVVEAFYRTRQKLFGVSTPESTAGDVTVATGMLGQVDADATWLCEWLAKELKAIATKQHPAPRHLGYFQSKIAAAAAKRKADLAAAAGRTLARQETIAPSADDSTDLEFKMWLESFSTAVKAVICNDGQFYAYISNLRAGRGGDVLLLNAPSKFQADYVRNHMGHHLRTALKRCSSIIEFAGVEVVHGAKTANI